MTILVFAYAFASPILSGDEAFSLLLVKHSFASITEITGLDVHPPLYYFVLKVWLMLVKPIFGHFLSEIVLARLLSGVIFGVLIFMTRKKLTAIIGQTNTLLFFLALTTLSFFGYSVQNIRMYELGILLVTVCYLYLIWYVQYEPHNWLLFVTATLFGALAFYTHYYAGLVIGIIYAQLLVNALYKKDWAIFRKLWGSIAIIIILFAPWLPTLYRQLTAVHGDYWITNSLSNWVFMLLSPFIPTNVAVGFMSVKIALIIAALIPIGILVYVILRRFKELFNDYLFGSAISLIVFEFIMAVLCATLFKPVFVARYFVFSSSILWIGVFVGLNRMPRPENLQRLLTIGFLLCGAAWVFNFTLVNQNHRPYADLITKSHINNTVSKDQNYCVLNEYLYPDKNNYCYGLLAPYKRVSNNSTKVPKHLKNAIVVDTHYKKSQKLVLKKAIVGAFTPAKVYVYHETK
jgi:hypothetical protein